MKINEIKLKQIIAEEILAELKELHEQQIINEGIFSMIWGALTGIPGGIVQNIKEWLAGKVLGWMGVKKGSTFFLVAQDFFGNLTMEDLANIMSGDKQCETITSELAGAFTEHLFEMLPEYLGIDTGGWLAGAFRESVGEELLGNINLAIGKSVCELNFSSLFSGNEAEDVNEVKKRIHEILSSNSELNEEKEWIQDAAI